MRQIREASRKGGNGNIEKVRNETRGEGLHSRCLAKERLKQRGGRGTVRCEDGQN